MQPTPDRSSSPAHDDAPFHFSGCSCAFHGRRLFTRGLALACATTALPVLAQDGVDVGGPSTFSKIVPAAEIEAAAQLEYGKVKQQAQQKNALGAANDPQVVRLRAIAQRLIPFSYKFNPRAREWPWEVNLIKSDQVNAFCMPSGKIAFFSGILERLQLSDDEVSMIMGHEIAHALQEHAREQMGKTTATRGAIEIGAALFGLGDGARTIANIGGQLLTLRFGRDDETEADKVGLELSARAGYDPQAGVTLWQKMAQASKGAPFEFLSTHPSGPSRIKEIQNTLPQVQNLYARAPKPTQRYGPPPVSK